MPAAVEHLAQTGQDTLVCKRQDSVGRGGLQAVEAAHAVLLVSVAPIHVDGNIRSRWHLYSAVLKNLDDYSLVFS